MSPILVYVDYIINKKIFLKWFAIISVAGFISCTSRKSYFTAAIREKVESKSIALNKLQYYNDRNIELRRELSSGEAKISSGKIMFINGKYINVVLLKKFTPGVCTNFYDDAMDISFEVGDNKSLKFVVPAEHTGTDIYRISMDGVVNNSGQITYDNKLYYIQARGTNAKLMIKKTITDKLRFDKRVMKGRKVQ